MATAKKEKTALLYKDIPLVKRGNVIIYGDLFDSSYVQMEILSTSVFKGLELATDVSVSLVEDGKTVKNFFSSLITLAPLFDNNYNISL